MDSESNDRYVGAVTAVLDDTQLAIMADLMEMTNEVVTPREVDAPVVEEGAGKGTMRYI